MGRDTRRKKRDSAEDFDVVGDEGVEADKDGDVGVVGESGVSS